MNDRLAANKAIARCSFEGVLHLGDDTAIDRYLAADTIGNDPTFGTGREAFRVQWRRWLDSVPDIHFAVEDVIAEGDGSSPPGPRPPPTGASSTASPRPVPGFA